MDADLYTNAKYLPLFSIYQVYKLTIMCKQRCIMPLKCIDQVRPYFIVCKRTIYFEFSQLEKM